MASLATSGGNPAMRDSYEPIRRLAMVRLPPVNKPITSFSIADILNSKRFGSHRPVRQCPQYAASLHDFIKPWNSSPPQSLRNTSPDHHRPRTESPPDSIGASPPPPPVSSYHMHKSPGRSEKHYYMLDSPSRDLHSDHLTDSDDDEIEVDVTDEDDVPVPTLVSSGKKVSPLDALLNMTKTTFDAKSKEHIEGMTDAKREQLNIFNKSQPAKKRRKSRTAFTNQQIYQLEKRFLYQKYLTPADRDELATGLDLSTAQVITWFQNRRAKLKRDLEELKADVTAAKTSDTEHKEVLSAANINEQELYEKHGLRRCERKESLDCSSSSSNGSTTSIHDNNSSSLTVDSMKTSRSDINGRRDSLNGSPRESTSHQSPEPDFHRT